MRKQGRKQEAKFLAKLSHPNIVQLKCICLTESSMMMEFMLLDLQPYRSINVVHSVNELLLHLIDQQMWFIQLTNCYYIFQNLVVMVMTSSSP